MDAPLHKISLFRPKIQRQYSLLNIFRNYIFEARPLTREIFKLNANAISEIRFVNTLCIGIYISTMNSFSVSFWGAVSDYYASNPTICTNPEILNYYYLTYRNLVICGIVSNAIGLLLSFFFYVTMPWTDEQFTWKKYEVSNPSLEKMLSGEYKSQEPTFNELAMISQRAFVPQPLKKAKSMVNINIQTNTPRIRVKSKRVLSGAESFGMSFDNIMDERTDIEQVIMTESENSNNSTATDTPVSASEPTSLRHLKRPLNRHDDNDEASTLNRQLSCKEDERKKEEGIIIDYTSLPEDIRNPKEKKLQEYMYHIILVKRIQVLCTMIGIICQLILVTLYYQIFSIPTRFLCDSEALRRNYVATRQAFLVLGVVGCLALTILHWPVHNKFVRMTKYLITSVGTEKWKNIVTEYEYWVNLLLAVAYEFATQFIPYYFIITYAVGEAVSK
jgi:hypothetical protein